MPPGEGRGRSVCAGIYQIVHSGGLQQVGGDSDNEEVEHHRDVSNNLSDNLEK
jgi:hypothetical protein